MSEGCHKGCGGQRAEPQGVGLPSSPGEPPGSCAKPSADLPSLSSEEWGRYQSYQDLWGIEDGLIWFRVPSSNGGATLSNLLNLSALQFSSRYNMDNNIIYHPGFCDAWISTHLLSHLIITWRYFEELFEIKWKMGPSINPIFFSLHINLLNYFI